MGLFIDGIAASENIDTSGERLSIAGMDISTLAVDGPVTWEHEIGKVTGSDGKPQDISIKIPSQVVGKVLKAVKIFSEKDCQDDRQLYFWNKVKTPFLYCLCELLDDYTDAAKDIAGKFRYDADKKHQNERGLMNFSIEGGKIEKKGIDVIRSVARKLTLTIMPCNKAAVAEMVPTSENKKVDIDSLFKTENDIEIEIFPSSQIEKLSKNDGGASMPAAAGGLALSEKPALAVATHPSKRGRKIGNTSSGKDVYSHGMVGEYDNFNEHDHAQAADFHRMAHRNSTKDPKAQDHHAMKAKLHDAAARSLNAKSKRFDKPMRKNDEVTQKIDPLAPSVYATPGHAQAQAREGKHAPSHLGQAVRQSHRNVGAEEKFLEDRPDADRWRKKFAHGSQQWRQKALGIARSNLTKLKNQPKPNLTRSEKMIKSMEYLVKALDAGSALASPANLTQGAALGKQNLSNKMHAAGQKPTGTGPSIKPANISRPDTGFGKIVDKTPKQKPGFGKVTVKSENLQRAEQEYQNWSKREQFETFMKSRMPSLTKGEIQVIGQTMLLAKSMKMEKALSKISKK